MPLLEVNNLQTEFKTPAGLVQAVRGVSFWVDAGETVGVVGESGSGKSVTALSLMGLIPSPPGKIKGGSVLLEGRELLSLTPKEMQRVRGSQVAMVFQDPMTAFDPVFTIGHQITETIQAHRPLSKLQLCGRCRRVGKKPPGLCKTIHAKQMSADSAELT